LPTVRAVFERLKILLEAKGQKMSLENLDQGSYV
jgi:hypothetical protein